jgi:protocatechuate 3,4-dioxygenase alpha subunit
MYFHDEGAANDADPALARVEPNRRHTLIARQDAGALHFDVRLQGEDETVFFAL